MPPNLPRLARRKAPRNTSRKRDVYFSPILSPPCLNMDLRPCLRVWDSIEPSDEFSVGVSIVEDTRSGVTIDEKVGGSKLGVENVY